MSKLVAKLKTEDFCTRLTEGSVLALDPSIGSTSSQLGYATYVNMELTDAGIVKMPAGLDTEARLREIGRVLREEFEEADILVIEDIPPSFNPKSGRPSRWITAGWKKLHEAAGACIASAKAGKVVRVHPATWKKFSKGYEKSDVADAVLIGYAAIAEACKIAKLPAPQKVYIVTPPDEGELTNGS